MQGLIAAGTAFTASAVEAVEALTIVLAVGTARTWRSALGGTAWAVGVLAVIVAIAGPACIFLPLRLVTGATGIALLFVGFTWLRKAILRYSGRKAMHDENAIYQKNVTSLRAGAATANAKNGLRDRTAFLAAFNGVLIEGLEVVIIVITLSGADRGAGLAWTSLGAAAAIIVVAVAGVLLRRPLARVPENAMKYLVGIMLVSVGTFWTCEAFGVAWPHGDLALIGIVTSYLALSTPAIFVLRRRPALTKENTV